MLLSFNSIGGRNPRWVVRWTRPFRETWQIVKRAQYWRHWVTFASKIKLQSLVRLNDYYLILWTANGWKNSIMRLKSLKRHSQGRVDSHIKKKYGDACLTFWGLNKRDWYLLGVQLQKGSAGVEFWAEYPNIEPSIRVLSRVFLIRCSARKGPSGSFCGIEPKTDASVSLS